MQVTGGLFDLELVQFRGKVKLIDPDHLLGLVSSGSLVPLRRRRRCEQTFRHWLCSD